MIDEQRLAKLSQLIRVYLEQASGRITTREIDTELNIITSEGKSIRRGIIKQYCDNKKLERIANVPGMYRVLDLETPKIDWQQADPKNVIKLKWPFELEQFIKIYPKSIICVAGGKDAGKTRFLHDLVLLNMNHPLGVDLFNSETGKESLRERFDDTGIEIGNPAPFNVYERYDNFADVIDPDRISVIDYLDLNSEVYMVGDEIDRIFRKLKGGIAVIGLQKPPPTITYVRGVKKLVYRDLAYGGGFTAKRAILYISLDNNIMKIIISKTPLKRGLNPKNKMWSFWIEDGARFKDIRPYTEGALNNEGVLNE